MKALVLREIKKPLVLEDRACLSPNADELVVDLRAAALNRRDYWITQGMYPGIRTPIVLGSDGAGVVSSVGSEGEASWVGREVIINPGFEWGVNERFQSDRFHILGLPRDGTLAEQVVVPVSQVYEKPKALTWTESAALPLAGVTAYRAVFSQGELKAGENVLITGAGGGVATLALQMAVAVGARVWVTSSSDRKIERSVALGAKGGFDYRDENWSKAMLDHGIQPDLIVDSAGGDNYDHLVELASPGGRIVNYGATVGLTRKLDLFKVFWKQLTLRGSTMGSPVDFEAMLRFIEKHRLKPMIETEMPLAEAQKALTAMKHSPQFGKFVLRVGSS